MMDYSGLQSSITPGMLDQYFTQMSGGEGGLNDYSKQLLRTKFYMSMFPYMLEAQQKQKMSEEDRRRYEEEKAWRQKMWDWQKQQQMNQQAGNQQGYIQDVMNQPFKSGGKAFGGQEYPPWSTFDINTGGYSGGTGAGGTGTNIGYSPSIFGETGLPSGMDYTPQGASAMGYRGQDNYGMGAGAGMMGAGMVGAGGMGAGFGGYNPKQLSKKQKMKERNPYL